MLEQSLGQRPGWMLAVSRVLLALTIFALSTTDTGNPGFETEPDDLLALAYLAGSIAILAIYVTSWWLAYRIRQLALVIDFLAYVMIMYLIEPMQSGFFAASITMLAFLTLSVAIQWGWKQAAIVIALLNLFCFAMIAQMLGMDMSIDWGVLIRRQAYQLLISFFLIWAANWVQTPRVSAFSTPPGLASNDQFARALEFARQQLQAPFGALCWVGQSADACNAATIGLDDDCKGKSNRCPSDFIQQLRAPALFDLRQGRCITLCDNRLIRTQMTRDEREFAVRFGVMQGIYIPMTGASGKGRVVLGTPALAGADILRFALEAGRELSQSFDSQSYYQSLEQIAVAKVRNNIAQDLHDNVAQSLAGTRYWLDSLSVRSGRGESIVADLNELSNLLRAEHSQILGTIEYLLNPSGKMEIDLIAELKALAETMSRHWQIAINLAGDPAPIQISNDLLHELKSIVREAISNAIRHGHADKVVLEVERLPGELKLEIANNGRKFETNLTNPKTINSRVRNLHGKLDIVSQTAETRISIAIPLGA